MDFYKIWVNLLPGVKDLEFCESTRAYLDRLQRDGLIEGYSIRRRKLGFGPPTLGEFNISIQCDGLDQLDRAFLRVAVRDQEMEELHEAVYSKITDYQSALYRDFPDAVRPQ